MRRARRPALNHFRLNRQTVGSTLNDALSGRDPVGEAREETVKAIPSITLCAVLASLWLGPAARAGETVEGDDAAGETRYKETCINCHGKEGKGMASFPSIAGNDAEFIESRLRSYRAKEKVGPNSALLFSWAGELTDEEIANLAAFISTSFE